MTAPALVLEQLMAHPRYPEIAQAIRAITPKHLTDQVDAAASDAFGITKLIAKHLDSEIGAVCPADAPGWLRLSLAVALVEYAEGRATTCRHAPTFDSPQPVIAAAWKPGLVTCLRCARLFAIARNDPDNFRCDVCGRVDSELCAAAVQLGALVFQYGACSDCGPLRATQNQDLGRSRGTRRVKPRGSRGQGRGRPSR